MKIWANVVVHNEENFVWFAVKSVIDFVDKVLVYDTGSKDKTVDVITKLQKIYPEKIIFKKVGRVDKEGFTKVRQEMLDRSYCDWILILDGDEIWWKNSVQKVVSTVRSKGHNLNGIVTPFYTLLGDIYHFQEEKAGEYTLLGKKGHFSLRAINRKIPKLHVDLPYGQEGYYDENNIPIHEKKNVIFLNAPYLHATHLQRSSAAREDNKIKHELGHKFPKDFVYPEVLYQPYPEFVPSPWETMSNKFLIKAAVLTIPRKIKRRVFRRF